MQIHLVKFLNFLTTKTNKNRLDYHLSSKMLNSTAINHFVRLGSRQFTRSMSSPSSLLLVDRKDGDKVCHLTLNDPKKRNALSFELLQCLKSAINIEMVENQSLRVFVLSATPPAFSAGHNLKELTSEAGLTKHVKVFSLCTEVMKLIQDMPYPIVACVEGVAAAAGCQLAASCDILVASDKATFAVPGIKAGLFCSTPGVALSRAVPRKIAMDMLLTGEPIDANGNIYSG